MIYTLNNVVIDSAQYINQLKNGLRLPVMKDIMDASGCSLPEALKLTQTIIIDEKIDMAMLSSEISNYHSDT